MRTFKDILQSLQDLELSVGDATTCEWVRQLVHEAYDLGFEAGEETEREDWNDSTGE